MHRRDGRMTITVIYSKLIFIASRNIFYLKWDFVRRLMPRVFFAGEVCQELLAGTIDIWGGFIPFTRKSMSIYSDVETSVLAYLRIMNMNKPKC